MSVMDGAEERTPTVSLGDVCADIFK